jgi:hypothetical protein
MFSNEMINRKRINGSNASMQSILDGRCSNTETSADKDSLWHSTVRKSLKMSVKCGVADNDCSMSTNEAVQPMIVIFRLEQPVRIESDT